ncbi:hypothetical protein CfE428DRAFT_4696 [Chthoniobacter flavus Ellin428]|uniref:Uncharacterized protein n=1 Tax=Chthoniobacter flavus Ellin428 TaxID=497964 RepID=B4D706_9BACT|nr:hypothetical protein CfE428DRAFT_4696 [Chthoniobacter flavus Ellin428]
MPLAPPQAQALFAVVVKNSLHNMLWVAIYEELRRKLLCKVLFLKGKSAVGVPK